MACGLLICSRNDCYFLELGPWPWIQLDRDLRHQTQHSVSLQHLRACLCNIALAKLAGLGP